MPSRTEWLNYVQDVRDEYNIGYRAAFKKASQLRDAENQRKLSQKAKRKASRKKTQYVYHGFDLTDKHMEKLLAGETITLSEAKLIGDVELKLSKQLLAQVNKAIDEGKSMKLKLSKSNIVKQK